MIKSYKEIFVGLVKNASKNDKTIKIWKDTLFEYIKYTNNTNKGYLAEKFLEIIFSDLDYVVKKEDYKHTHYDLIVNGKKIEVKLATLDTNNNFQFNGLNPKYHFDLLFLLGVEPNDLWFILIKKENINLNKLVSMNPKSTTSYKYTLNKKQMFKYWWN
ncbi:hypothetical protein JTY60_00460 [symbiont of Argiope bruennichi]|uniref:hypothetical protein n=1 Tax=symbiont of Argiope bruennichi TaxID=2810479 RepID=UPI003DA2AB66